MIEKYVKAGEPLTFEAFHERLTKVTSYQDANGNKYSITIFRNKLMEFKPLDKSTEDVCFLHIGKLFKTYSLIQETNEAKPERTKRLFPTALRLEFLEYLRLAVSNQK